MHPWIVRASVAQDCYHVLKFWDKMHGEPHGLENCCEMEGVVCQDDSVVAIEWGSRGLSGEISGYQIGNLKDLVAL